MNENEIKYLLDLKSKLTALIEQKRDQGKLLEQEIAILTHEIQQIDAFVTKGSFQTANMLVDAESYLRQHQNVPLDNLNYTRKIFSNKKDLIAVLQFENQNVIIRFPNPALIKITQELYVEKFVKSTLLSLKKEEPNLKPTITKIQQGSEEYISTITLENIHQFESFESIVNNIQKLITTG